MRRFFHRTISILTLLAFLGTNTSWAQVQPSAVSYQPLAPIAEAQGLTSVLKGLKVDLKDPLHLQFIVDPQSTPVDKLQDDSQQLIKYFLAALTVPSDDLWVNLSPAEPDRIIAPSFGQTDMGRDLLAQDYLLKQLTSSLLSPENEAGKTFWEAVYEKAYASGISHSASGEKPNANNQMLDAFDTFNKVWIVPAEAEVYQQGAAVYVANARLKVMLDADYLASGISHSASGEKPNANDQMLDAKDILRSTVIPLIEKEVNEGEQFVPLRRIYHAVILAKWFKDNLKKSLLGSQYADQNRVQGIDDVEASAISGIYGQYLEAFRKGAYDVIREDYDPVQQDVVTRKYFTGGAILNPRVTAQTLPSGVRLPDNAMMADVRLSVSENQDSDSAMIGVQQTLDFMGTDGQAEFLKDYQTFAVRLRSKLFAESDISGRTELPDEWKVWSGFFNQFKGSARKALGSDLEIFVNAEQILESIGLSDNKNAPGSLLLVDQDVFSGLGSGAFFGAVIIADDEPKVIFSRQALQKILGSGKKDISKHPDIVSQFIFFNAQAFFMSKKLDPDVSFHLAWILKSSYDRTGDFANVLKKYQDVLRYLELLPDGFFDHETGIVVPGVKNAVATASSADVSINPYFFSDKAKPVAERNLEALRDGRLTSDFIENVMNAKTGEEFSKRFLESSRTFNISSLAPILLIVEERPELFDRLYLDLDNTIFTTRGYFASEAERDDLRSEGRQSLQTVVSKHKKEEWILEHHPEFFTLTEPDLADRINRIWKKSPQIKIRALTARHKGSKGEVEQQTLQILKILGFPVVEKDSRFYSDDTFYVGFMGSMESKAKYMLSRRLGDPNAHQRKTVFIDDKLEDVFTQKQLQDLRKREINLYAFRYEQPDLRERNFDWRQSYQMHMIAELAGDERFGLTFAFDVLALLRKEDNWSVRAEMYRYFLNYAQHKKDGRLTMTLLESMSDLLWRMQHNIYDYAGVDSFGSSVRAQNQAWAKKENYEDLLESYFRILTPYNPGHFTDAYESGDLQIQKIQKRFMAADVGNYEWILDENSMYIFLEPLMKMIIESEPDVVVLPGSGARPFEDPLNFFLEAYPKETGRTLKTKIVTFPISTYEAKDTPYELLRWMRILRGELVTGDPEDERLKDYLQTLNMKAILEAKNVLVIDDNVVTGGTAKDLQRIFSVLNPDIQSFSVGTPLLFNDFSNYAPLPVLGTFQLPVEYLWGTSTTHETPPVIVNTNWEDRKSRKSDLVRGEKKRKTFYPPENLTIDSPEAQAHRTLVWEKMSRWWSRYKEAMSGEGVNIRSWFDAWRNFKLLSAEFPVVPEQSQRFNSAGLELDSDVVIGSTGEQQYLLTRKIGKIADEQWMFDGFSMDAETIRDLSQDNVFTYDIRDVVTREPLGILVLSEEQKKQIHTGDLPQKVLVVRKIQPIMEHDHQLSVAALLKGLQSHMEFKHREQGLECQGLYIHTGTNAGIGHLSQSHRVRRDIDAKLWFLPHALLEKSVNGSNRTRILWTPLTVYQREVLESVKTDLGRMNQIKRNLESKGIDLKQILSPKERFILERIFNTMKSALPLSRNDLEIVRSLKIFYEDIWTHQKKYFEESGLLKDSFRGRLEKYKVKLLYEQLILAKMEELRNDYRMQEAERAARQKNQSITEEELTRVRMRVLFSILSASGAQGNIHLPVDYLQYENDKKLTMIRMRAAFNYFFDYIWPLEKDIGLINRNTMFRFGLGEIADYFQMQNGKDVLLSELLVKDGWERSSISKRARLGKKVAELSNADDIARAVTDFFERGNYGAFIGTKSSYEIPDEETSREFQDFVSQDNLRSALTPQTQIKLYVSEWIGKDKKSQTITTAVLRGKGMAFYHTDRFDKKIRYAPYRKDISDIKNWIFGGEIPSEGENPWMLVRVSDVQLQRLNKMRFWGSVFEEELFWHVEKTNPEQIPIPSGKKSVLVKLIPSEKYGRVLAFYRFEILNGNIVETDLLKVVTQDFKDVISDVVVSTRVIETTDSAMLNLSFVDGEEKNRLVQRIMPVTNEGRRKIYNRFPDIFKKIVDGQERTPFATAEDFDRHPIVKDEHGRYWFLKILKSREEGQQIQEKHIRSTAKFAELASRNISNTDQIHLLTQEEANQLRLTGNFEDAYLSLIVDDSYQPQVHDPVRALAASAISAFWLQKMDFNLFNMAFSGEIPVSIDNDGILLNAYDSRDDFFVHFTQQLEGGSSSSTSLGKKIRKNLTEFEKAQILLRRNNAGMKLAEAYELGLRNTQLIVDVVRRIQALSEADLYALAEQSFPELENMNPDRDQDAIQDIYDEIGRMSTEAKNNSHRLARDLNDWLKFLTGKDYGLTENNAMMAEQPKFTNFNDALSWAQANAGLSGGRWQTMSFEEDIAGNRMSLEELDRRISNDPELSEVQKSLERGLELIVFGDQMFMPNPVRTRSKTKSLLPLSGKMSYLWNSIAYAYRAFDVPFTTAVISRFSSTDFNALSPEVLTGVANDGLQTRLSVSDKAAELTRLVENKAHERGVSPDDIWKETLVIGFNSSDADMLKTVVYHGGLAVGIGDIDEPSVRDIIWARNFIHLPATYHQRPGREFLATEAILRMHQTWIMDPGRRGRSAGYDDPRQWSPVMEHNLRAGQWVYSVAHPGQESLGYLQGFAKITVDHESGERFLQFMDLVTGQRTDEGYISWKEALNFGLDIRVAPKNFYTTGRIKNSDAYGHIYEALREAKKLWETRVSHLPESDLNHGWRIVRRWLERGYLLGRHIYNLDTDELLYSPDEEPLVRQDDLVIADVPRVRASAGGLPEALRLRLRSRKFSTIAFGSPFSLVPSSEHVERFGVPDGLDEDIKNSFVALAEKNPQAAVFLFGKSAKFMENAIQRRLPPGIRERFFSIVPSGVWSLDASDQLSFHLMQMFEVVSSADRNEIIKALRSIFARYSSFSQSTRVHIERWLQDPTAYLKMDLTDADEKKNLSEELRNIFEQRGWTFMDVYVPKDSPSIFVRVSDRVRLINAMHRRMAAVRKRQGVVQSWDEIWKETLFIGRTEEDIDALNEIARRGGTAIYTGSEELEGLGEGVFVINQMNIEAADLIMEEVANAGDLGEDSPNIQTKDLAMLNPFKNQMTQIIPRLKKLDLMILTDPHFHKLSKDNILKRRLRWFFDMDHTVITYADESNPDTEKKAPLETHLSYIWHQIKQTYQYFGWGFSSGILSGSDRDGIDRWVTGELTENVRGSHYTASDNGGRIFFGADSEKIFEVNLQQEMGDHWTALLQIIEEVKSRFGLSDRDAVYKTASYAVFERDPEQQQRREDIAEFIKDKLQEKGLMDIRFGGKTLKVLTSSIAINISLYDKGEALEKIVAHTAKQEGVSEEEIWKETAVGGDSEIDLPMFEKALEHGGIGVWVGNPDHAGIRALKKKYPDALRIVTHKDASGRIIKGREAIAAVLRIHQNWLKFNKGAEVNDPKQLPPLDETDLYAWTEDGRLENSGGDWVYVPRQKVLGSEEVEGLARVDVDEDGQGSFQIINHLTGELGQNIFWDDAVGMDIRMIPPNVYASEHIQLNYESIYDALQWMAQSWGGQVDQVQAPADMPESFAVNWKTFQKWMQVGFLSRAELKNWGHEVFDVPSEELLEEKLELETAEMPEALRLLAKQKFDVVIVDSLESLTRNQGALRLLDQQGTRFFYLSSSGHISQYDPRANSGNELRNIIYLNSTVGASLAKKISGVIKNVLGPYGLVLPFDQNLQTHIRIRIEDRATRRSVVERLNQAFKQQEPSELFGSWNRWLTAKTIMKTGKTNQEGKYIEIFVKDPQMLWNVLLKQVRRQYPEGENVELKILFVSGGLRNILEASAAQGISSVWVGKPLDFSSPVIMYPDAYNDGVVQLLGLMAFERNDAMLNDIPSAFDIVNAWEAPKVLKELDKRYNNPAYYVRDGQVAFGIIGVDRDSGRYYFNIRDPHDVQRRNLGKVILNEGNNLQGLRLIPQDVQAGRRANSNMFLSPFLKMVQAVLRSGEASFVDNPSSYGFDQMPSERISMAWNAFVHWNEHGFLTRQDQDVLSNFLNQLYDMEDRANRAMLSTPDDFQLLLDEDARILSDQEFGVVMRQIQDDTPLANQSLQILSKHYVGHNKIKSVIAAISGRLSFWKTISEERGKLLADVCVKLYRQTDAFFLSQKIIAVLEKILNHSQSTELFVGQALKKMESVDGWRKMVMAREAFYGYIAEITYGVVTTPQELSRLMTNGTAYEELELMGWTALTKKQDRLAVELASNIWLKLREKNMIVEKDWLKIDPMHAKFLELGKHFFEQSIVAHDDWKNWSSIRDVIPQKDLDSFTVLNAFANEYIQQSIADRFEYFRNLTGVYPDHLEFVSAVAESEVFDQVIGVFRNQRSNIHLGVPRSHAQAFKAFVAKAKSRKEKFTSYHQGWFSIKRVWDILQGERKIEDAILWRMQQIYAEQDIEKLFARHKDDMDRAKAKRIVSALYNKHYFVRLKIGDYKDAYSYVSPVFLRMLIRHGWVMPLPDQKLLAMSEGQIEKNKEKYWLNMVKGRKAFYDLLKPWKLDSPELLSEALDLRDQEFILRGWQAAPDSVDAYVKSVMDKMQALHLSRMGAPELEQIRISMKDFLFNALPLMRAQEGMQNAIQLNQEYAKGRQDILNALRDYVDVLIDRQYRTIAPSVEWRTLRHVAQAERYVFENQLGIRTHVDGGGLPTLYLVRSEKEEFLKYFPMISKTAYPPAPEDWKSVQDLFKTYKKGANERLVRDAMIAFRLEKIQEKAAELQDQVSDPEAGAVRFVDANWFGEKLNHLNKVVFMVSPEGERLLVEAGILKPKQSDGAMMNESDVAEDPGGVDFRMDGFDVTSTGESLVFDAAAISDMKILSLRPAVIVLKPLKSFEEFAGVSAASLAQSF